MLLLLVFGGGVDLSIQHTPVMARPSATHIPAVRPSIAPTVSGSSSFLAGGGVVVSTGRGTLLVVIGFGCAVLILTSERGLVLYLVVDVVVSGLIIIVFTVVLFWFCKSVLVFSVTEGELCCCCAAVWVLVVENNVLLASSVLLAVIVSVDNACSVVDSNSGVVAIFSVGCVVGLTTGCGVTQYQLFSSCVAPQLILQGFEVSLAIKVVKSFTT